MGQVKTGSIAADIYHLSGGGTITCNLGKEYSKYIKGGLGDTNDAMGGGDEVTLVQAHECQDIWATGTGLCTRVSKSWRFPGPHIVTYG